MIIEEVRELLLQKDLIILHKGDRVISRDLIAIMRSRNVQFVANKVRPLTRIYPFFDSRDVSKYCVPKLLEIAMTSGVFQVGETVVGKMEGTGLGNKGSKTAAIRFRVAQLIIKKDHLMLLLKSIEIIHISLKFLQLQLRHS